MVIMWHNIPWLLNFEFKVIYLSTRVPLAVHLLDKTMKYDLIKSKISTNSITLPLRIPMTRGLERLPMS